ncbi:flagellar hook-associated protein FlgK [Paracoccus aerodenitrificans]|uniref:flagellar hook-associated protein FlgK n=1 Tax=Paracoccus aerodenitrificans TaxID=3017781 RepID=UPI0022F103F1|nr:flagellar hook-associated protein FlgK [Paracoccus aerodenitrificans]WBU63874.1 flagellar hook-associated protein FlgK [Paracoccus aerodenitrificans]
MSIANALNNAVSGLTAAARGTEVVSSNLANALTPGYARREVSLSPRTLSANGGGVQVDRIVRIISDSVLADLRLSSAALGKATASHEFFQSLEKAIGLPGDATSLSAHLTELETTLQSAASRPDSAVRLRAVFNAATELTKKLASVSDVIQENRTTADRKIAQQVNKLKNNLEEVTRLNRQIIVERAHGRDASSFIDTRQELINQISEIVPVREMERENGRIALFTASGAVLLDGKSPTQIDFRPSGKLTAEMASDSTLLGRLTIDDEVLSDAQISLFKGGSLSALFKVRDTHGIEAQKEIDVIARELYERFADPATDPTLTTDMAGLFIDGTGSFDPVKEPGLATRLRVNAAVDEGQGGNLWRIRDGIAASIQGDAGASETLLAMANALAESKSYHSATTNGAQGDLNNLVASLLSNASSSRLTAENRLTHAKNLTESLQDAIFTDAVDSDREMQMLLQLEAAYAANAKVIQAVDEMMESILRI